MEGFLFALLLVIVLIRWVYLRDRFNAIEGRLIVLERASMDWAQAWRPPAADAPPPRPAPPPVTVVRTPPTPDVHAPVVTPEQRPATERPATEEPFLPGAQEPPAPPPDRIAADRPAGAEPVSPSADMPPHKAAYAPRPEPNLA